MTFELNADEDWTDIELLTRVADYLEARDFVDHVVRCWEDDDSRLDDLMVVLDWVQESHMEGSTRIHDEAEYNGEVRKLNDAVRDIDGVRTHRGSSRLNGYSTFVTTDRRGF